MTYYGRTMETDHPDGCEVLTWMDAESLEGINKRNGWGFTLDKEEDMVSNHMMACINVLEGRDVKDNKLVMEKIEWALTDANFHTLCKLLHDNEYAKARKYIREE